MPYDNPFNNPYGGDNPWGGGGENLDSLLAQGGGTFMGGVTEAAKQDYGNLWQKWGQTQKHGWDAYIGGMGGAGDRYEDRHADYSKRMGELHTQSIKDQALYAETLSGLGKEYSGKMEQWAGNVASVTEEGLGKARDMRDASLAKMSDVEAEYKDFSKAAISAQSAGIASQYEDQKTAKIDAMKRSGAPQSAIDQATYSMDRDMGQQLQGQISTSMGSYQQELSQIGMTNAQMQAQAAGQEAQFVGMEAQAAGYEFQGKKAGLDYEMGSRSQAAQSMAAVKQQVTQQKTLMEQEHLAMQGRYDELEFQGQAQYAEFLKNNPAPQAAEFFAMELQYASMPYANRLAQRRMPGEASKQRATTNANILRKHPNMEGVNINLSMINPKDLQRRINSFFSNNLREVRSQGSLSDWINSGNYSGRGLAI